MHKTYTPWILRCFDVAHDFIAFHFHFAIWIENTHFNVQFPAIHWCFLYGFFLSLSRLPFLDSILFFRMIVLVGYCCHCCHWHCHYGVGTINPHPRRLSRMRCVCTFFRRNEMKWAWAWASMARILCWSFVRVQWHQVNWRLQLHCVYMRE